MQEEIQALLCDTRRDDAWRARFFRVEADRLERRARECFKQADEYRELADKLESPQTIG